jgi:hypothetical protein
LLAKLQDLGAQVNEELDTFRQRRELLVKRETRCSQCHSQLALSVLSFVICRGLLPDGDSCLDILRVNAHFTGENP